MSYVLSPHQALQIKNLERRQPSKMRTTPDFTAALLFLLPALVVSQGCGFATSGKYVLSMFIDVNFQNPVGLMSDSQLNQCINMAGPCQDSLSSVGIGPGYACRFYKDSKCTGTNLDNQRADISDFRNVAYPGGGNWNDKISSLVCVKI